MHSQSGNSHKQYYVLATLGVLFAILYVNTPDQRSDDTNKVVMCAEKDILKSAALFQIIESKMLSHNITDMEDIQTDYFEKLNQITEQDTILKQEKIQKFIDLLKNYQILEQNLNASKFGYENQLKEYESCKIDFENYTQTIHKGDIDKVMDDNQKEIEKLKNEIEEANKMIRELTQKRNGFEKNLTEMETREKILESNAKNSQAASEDFEKELKKLNNDLEDSNKKLQDITSTISLLNDQVAQYEKDIQNLSQIYQNSEKQIENAINNYGALSAQLSKDTKWFKPISAEVLRKNITDMADYSYRIIKQNKQLIDFAKGQLSDLFRLEAVHLDRSNSLHDVVELELQYNNSQILIQQLQNKHIENSNKIESERNFLKICLKNIDQYTKEKNELKQKQDEISSQKEKLSQQNEQQQSLIQQYKKEMLQIDTDKSKIQTNKKKIESSLSTQNNTLFKKEDKLQKLQLQLQESKEKQHVNDKAYYQEICAIEKKCRSLFQNVANRKKDLMKITSETSQYINEIEKLRSEIKQYKV